MNDPLAAVLLTLEFDRKRKAVDDSESTVWVAMPLFINHDTDVHIHRSHPTKKARVEKPPSLSKPPSTSKPSSRRKPASSNTSGPTRQLRSASKPPSGAKLPSTEVDKTTGSLPPVQEEVPMYINKEK